MPGAGLILVATGGRDRQNVDGRTTRDVTSREARYDGLAEWYDGHIGPFAEAAGRELLELLGAGPMEQGRNVAKR